MKQWYNNTLLLLFLLFGSVQFCFADGWKSEVTASLRGGYSTGEFMPFWARTGDEGILPVASSGLFRTGALIDYRSQKGFYFVSELDFVGYLVANNRYDSRNTSLMINRLYASVGWKMIHLDIGIKQRTHELGDLSISGGNVVYSGNSRNIPGINISTDWIYFEKGHWFGLKANLAHYQMIDNSFVPGTMLHNKSLSFKIALGRKVDFMGGLEHWAQWGGVSPQTGSQPSSFRDYIRIFFGRNGGENASEPDRINVLGNHLGKEYVRIIWRSNPFTMTFQYDKPFEDGSGMRWQNIPDGIWSLKFDLVDKKSIVTEVIYELITTTWQSGPHHDRPATEEEMSKQDPSDPFYGKIILGGGDNYFDRNNTYQSGWTYYGRSIGLPLIMPNLPSDDGITYGMACTRVRAHHIGIKGNIFLPYKFKSTFSKNFGKYNQPETSMFTSAPWQLSMALEVDLDRFMGRLPLSLGIGLYGDIGKVYQNCFGLTARLGFGKKFEW